MYLSLTHWFQRQAVLRNGKRVVGAQESSSDCQHRFAERPEALFPLVTKCPTYHVCESRTKALCRLQITEGRVI